MKNATFGPRGRLTLFTMTLCGFAAGLLLSPWTPSGPPTARAQSDPADPADPADSPARPDTPPPAQRVPGRNAMHVYYLEIVTSEVDKVCASYAAAGDTEFGEPDAGLGNARTAPMPGGGMVGVRAPLRATEEPVVRPYWLVDDIKVALAEAVKAGGVLAHPPLEIPGHGTFAIYIQGGVEHGLWEK